MSSKPKIDAMAEALKSRKAKFVHFRWLLFMWLGAVAALHSGTRTELGGGVYGLFLLFVVSQAVLWALPPRFYDGMKVLNAIFLLDLNFVLLGFWVSNQLQPELMITLFLGTFMAALSKSLAQSLATTGVILSVYVGFKLRTPEGFDFSKPDQLLQLPFLFISAVHSSLLASEAASELSARQILTRDKSRISTHMNSTLTEIARHCKDMSALVDALPFGAIMLDSDARMRVCNDIAEEVLGIDSASLLDGPLDNHPRLALLRPYLEKALSDPLSDFLSVEFPGEDGGTWTMNLGVYPVREGEANRGLLLVLIPQGYGAALQQALPKPLVLPTEALPILQAMPRQLPVLAGLSLGDLGLSYG